MKAIVAAGFACLALLVLGCGAAGTEGPEDTVRVFLETAKAGDLEGARSYLVADERDDEDFALGDPKGWSYQIGSASHEGETAIVPVSVSKDGDAQEMPFVLLQEEGAWRISLDRTIEKMLGDSLEGLEGLEDAMSEAMEGAMEGVMKDMADELSKDMEDAMKEAGGGEQK